MTTQVDPSRDAETCEKLISLGYARSNHVRLYGLEVQLISDPFPLGEGGIAVEVVEKNGLTTRTLKLPLSVVQVAKRKREKRTTA